jgi:hypothetical protein
VSPGELVRALRRRWYVLLLAALLTAAGAYHVLRPTQLYLSQAVVVAEPPATGNQPNQYTNLNPTVATLSYGVIQQLEAPAGVAELRAAGVHGSYQLIPRNSGTTATPSYQIPTLQVQSEQPDPVDADQVVKTIIGVYNKHLTALQTQQDVPKASRIVGDLLVSPSAAPVYGTKSRGLVGTAVLGAFLGVLGALWLDRWLLGRRARRGGTVLAT